MPEEREGERDRRTPECHLSFTFQEYLVLNAWGEKDIFGQRIPKGFPLMLLVPAIGKFCKFCKFLAGSLSAVSKRILQENMRLTAFFKLYKMCILLHRCNLKIFVKNRFEKSAKFREISANFLQMSQNSQNSQN